VAEANVVNLPVEVIALNRMGYGPRPGDVQRLRAAGFAAYVEQQLRPDDGDDTLCRHKLESVRLHIEYEAGKTDGDDGKPYPACKEDRPLRYLTRPAADLWKLTDAAEPTLPRPIAPAERDRALAEVRAATWIRAVYSKWQLREVLADFWHNHFNVNAEIDDGRVMPMFVAYDRDVIRKHCMGNFRQFLEAVAQSPVMLAYLNNASSRASPANENFARELFELHTLGRDNYLNHLYNRWRDVPGATQGQPSGYIDQDVYEAARAFTGWTIADGTDSDRGDHFPNTGQFYYYDGWHDNYQKRVLGVEFDPNQPPLADGRRVLDLVAAHPGTARHLCGKLCRRFVGDLAPSSLIDKAVAAWTAARDAPDQIAQTVRTILLSPEFAATPIGRARRPFETVVAFLRATEADVSPNDDIFYLTNRMGQTLFAWPSPAGHPEASGYWLGTAAMLGRFNAPLALLDDNQKSAGFHLARATPAEVATPRQLCGFWSQRMLGHGLDESDPAAFAVLLKYTSGDDDPDKPLELKEKELIDRIAGLVSIIGMMPDFQVC
jgi:uncharacterized protein (DUF1800 family)